MAGSTNELSEHLDASSRERTDPSLWMELAARAFLELLPRAAAEIDRDNQPSVAFIGFDHSRSEVFGNGALLIEDFCEKQLLQSRLFAVASSEPSRKALTEAGIASPRRPTAAELASFVEAMKPRYPAPELLMWGEVTTTRGVTMDSIPELEHIFTLELVNVATGEVVATGSSTRIIELHDRSAQRAPSPESPPVGSN